jgi:DNA-directed RNA polymerase I, II, and III subunit RPABC2
MSDDDNEYNSDNSESNDSDNEIDIVVSSNKKPLFKPSVNIKAYSAGVYDDDADIDDADADIDDADADIDDADADEEENQIGGVEDIPVEEEESDIEDDGESEDDEEPDIEINEDGEPIENVSSQKLIKPTNKNKKTQLIVQDDDDEDEDDEYDENYLQKFDNEIIKNYIDEFHPECLNHNYEEIQKLTVVTKNSDGIIIDPLHKTIPFLTKYEKARIIGQRAKQLETGAKPLVKIPENIIDSYIIADLELKEKRIPFIIRRPIPGGGSEYWNLKDLEFVAY